MVWIDKLHDRLRFYHSNELEVVDESETEISNESCIVPERVSITEK